LGFLEKKLVGQTALDLLRAFFQNLVQTGFAQVPLPADHLVKSRELLVESCELLLERMGRNLENFASALYYVDKLAYISKYAESRGIKRYRWAYGKGPGIPDLNLFWTAGLIGVFLLHEALRAASLEPQPAKENPLLRIGVFFQKDAGEWANLLVGDIGCTFSIDPFTTPGERERAHGIKLKSVEGAWISPYDAECFYDGDNERISYRSPKADERTESV